MDTLKNMLIERARQRWGKIHPCMARADFDECFTVEGEVLFFWFNAGEPTPSGAQSTHIEKEAIS